MITFTNQSLQTILPILKKTLEKYGFVTFSILNPDICEGYSGTVIEVAGISYLHRSYKAWTDMAEILHCRIRTPTVLDSKHIEMTFKKIHTTSFHTDSAEVEKYGVTSHFFKIYKMEEPAFLYYYLQALNNVNIKKRKDILDLGINRGDEFKVIKNLLDTHEYEDLKLIGIDYSSTAIAYAKKKYPEENTVFYTHDINDIDSLKLGRFDLLISIGTLHVRGISFKPYFMKLIQNYMKKDSAIILGFPNSRWIGGEMIYGAKAPNYAMSEMSILWNDVIFCKKYLQQKKFRVTITGKHYIFLTATKIG